MIVHLVEEGLGGGGRSLFRVCKILSKLLGRGGCERKISYMYNSFGCYLPRVFLKGFKWTGSLSCMELYAACD
jgi:hypothetical protein